MKTESNVEQISPRGATLVATTHGSGAGTRPQRGGWGLWLLAVASIAVIVFIYFFAFRAAREAQIRDVPLATKGGRP